MAKYTSFDSFIKAHIGKAMDYDGVAGCQCVDLIKYYLDEVFDIKPGAWGDAHAYYNEWTTYTDKLQKNFTRIANTPDFVPKKGDIMVWGKTLNGNWGHVALCDGVGDTTYFYSYDNNWTGNHDAVTRIKHNYSHVLGVLRPKDQTKVTGKAATTTTTNPSTGSVQKKVIDISQYQTNVNYAAAAKEIDGMIIRIGYRGWGAAGTLSKDSQFENHVKGAINNKIPYGFYFFSQATNTAEAKAEADYAYSLIKSYSPTYPVYIDIEDSGAPNNSGRADKNTKATWTEVCKAFCNRIKELGLKPGVYSGEYWFNNKVDLSQLTSYSIWCAKYGTNNGTAQTKPNISTYDGWQFTSVYKVSGFSAGIDMSYFYKDFAGGATKTDTSTKTETEQKPTVSYTTCYVNDKDGLNYRATPNGTLKGTLAYGATVEVVTGSEQTVNNLVWVKIKNGNYVAKKYLSTTKPATSTTPTYKVGNVYTLQYDMKVRAGAGTNYVQKKYTQLTADGKKNAYKQTYAVLKKGTKVTVQQVIKVSSTEYWAKIPSGYICLYSKNAVYVK